jgi:hypothetical protein
MPHKSLLLFLIVTSAPALQAQVTGVPVDNSGIPQGFTLGAEIGFPSQDYGGGTAYALRGTVGGRYLGFAGLISRYNVDDPFPNQTGFGLAMSLDLVPGRSRLFDASVQGAGEVFSLSGDVKAHFPIGLGLAFRRPHRHFLVKLWAAPRVDLFTNTFDSPSHTDTNFGMSGGLDVTWYSGFGLRAGADRVFAGNGFHPTTWSLGVRYVWRQ